MLFVFMQHWRKLEGNQGDLWPAGRADHAAVFLGPGGDHAQLFITGGWGTGLNTLSDAWTLDIESMRWREVSTDCRWAGHVDGYLLYIGQ